MSKEILKIKVQEIDMKDMIRILLGYNEYDYLIIKKPTDARRIYEVEAHIGDTDESNISD